MHVLRVSLIGLVAVCLGPWAAAGGEPVEPFLQARWDRAEVSSNGLFRVVPLESEEEGTVILLISWWPTDPTVTHIAERPERNPSLTPNFSSNGLDPNFKKETKEPEPEVEAEKDWASILEAAETLLEGYDPWERFHENDDSFQELFEPPDGDDPHQQQDPTMPVGKTGFQRSDSFGYTGGECPPCTSKVTRCEFVGGDIMMVAGLGEVEIPTIMCFFKCESSCGSDEICCDGQCCPEGDRCCCDPKGPCCGDPDPCCNPNDPCCGNPDRCCNSDNPCCGSSDPCCNVNDPCCGDPDPCCNPDNPCCGVSCDEGLCLVCEDGECVSMCEPGQNCCGGTCCPSDWTCCNSGDGPCCEPDKECCGDECCGGTCCDTDDGPCCDPDECEVCSNGLQGYWCMWACEDWDHCTNDWCEEGVCINESINPAVVCDDQDECTSDTCCPHIGCVNDDLGWGCTATPGSGSGCAGSEVELAFTICNVSADCAEIYTWVLEEHSPPPPPEPSVFVNLPLNGGVGLEPSECREETTVVQIAETADPGPADVRLTITSTRTDACNTNGTIPGPGCATNMTVTVKTIDLDVDSDNDGDIDEADDAIEDSAYTPQTPGKWLWINNDDTDGDQTSDNANNVIDGMNDLVDIGQLVVQPVDPELADDPHLFVEVSGLDVVRVFDGYSSGAEGIVGAAGVTREELVGAFGGTTLGVEGLSGGTVTISLVLEDGGQEICRDDVLVTVVDLMLTWETLIGEPLEANDHPEAGLGDKCFPGATAPGGGWSDLFQVRIATDPPVEGLNIYLKAFDPDDPSAKDNVVDNDLDGGDNRDENHHDNAELSFTQVVTMPVGDAISQFRVAHQPGDNHRIAATLKQNALDILTDNNVPPSGTDPGTEGQVDLFTGQISPLLTVWRKLHVEVDSMAAPDATNTETGTVQGPPVFDPGTLRAIIDINDLDYGVFEFDDQHYVGRIDINGFGSFTTVGTIVNGWPWDDQVEIMNAPANIVNANGAAYTLWDDDAGSVPPFTMIGFDAPPVPLPIDPDTTELAQRFDSAYVAAQPPMPLYYDANTPFVRNIETNDDEQVNATANANKDVNSTPQFWVVHVVSGFQGPVSKDLDPDTDLDSVYGVTAFYGTEGQSGGSIIHLETIRDMYRGNAASIADLERFTVVHEVGHQFYLEHSHGGCLYIMTDSAGPSPFSPIREFSPISLKLIREREYPQGP